MNAAEIVRMGKVAWKEGRKAGRSIADWIYVNKHTETATAVNMDMINRNGLQAAVAVKPDETVAATGRPSAERVLYQPSEIQTKTAITADIRTGTAPGIDAESPEAMHAFQRMIDEMEAHRLRIDQARNKMALDVIVNGRYDAVGTGGVVIDSLDLNRKGANKITYSFGIAGSTFGKAVAALHKVLIASHAPSSGMVIIAGASWLTKMAGDADLQADARGSQFAAMANLAPVATDVEGLHFAGRIQPVGMVGFADVYSYNPFPAYNIGGNASPYIADNQLIMFPGNSMAAFGFQMGVDVYNSATGMLERQTGDAVIDTYQDANSKTEFIRSQSRPFFIWGNPNYTAVATGTNF